MAKTLANNVQEVWLDMEQRFEKIRAIALAVERAAYNLRDEVLTDDDILVSVRCLTLLNIIDTTRIIEQYPISEVVGALYDETFLSGFEWLHYVTSKKGLSFEIKIYCNTKSKPEKTIPERKLN